MRHLTHTFILFKILILMSGCATLSDGGSKVTRLSAGDVRPFCRVLYQGTFRDNANLIRNYAATIGAKHIVVGEKPNPQEVNVSLITCPELIEMTEVDVKNKCNAKDSDACIELAYRSGNDVKLYLRNLQKACSLKNDAACQLVVQTNKNIQLAKNNEQNERRLTRAVTNCDKGNASDCLLIASTYNQNGHYEEAIRMAERACALGNKNGCLLQSNLLSQRQQQNQFLMQVIMMQQQNAAASWQSVQQSTNAAIQNQMLYNTLLKQQQPVQQAPAPQKTIQPSAIPQTTNCKGKINPTGRFSATCN